MKKLILIYIGLFFLFTLNSQNINVVIKNKSNAYIVVLEKNNKQLNKVSQDLKDYIFKSTKANLSIVNSFNSSSTNIIICTQFKDVNFDYELLNEDGFIIKTVGKNLVISGKTDSGTTFGVYEFLEKFLGIRWLMPTDLWTEIPLKNNLTFGKIDIKENPKFLSRSFFPINLQSNDVLLKEWGEKNRLSNRVEFHHNMRNIFNSDVIVKKYPHFLPIVDGKKYFPKNNKDYKWQPNFEAKDIEKFAANEIINYFMKNPDMNSFSLGINDTGNFDERNIDKINKVYLGLENYSSAYYRWVNKTVNIVNQAVPNKKFGLLAYSRVAAPPDFKLEDNVVPFITYERVLWLDPILRQKDIEISKQWQGVTKEYGWYDYVYGGPYLVPRVYFKHYYNYLNTAYDLNVKYYVAEYYPNWIEGPKGWIMTKLLWNPTQNLENLLDDWYSNAVGINSAKYLREFYDIWETFWTQEIVNSKWWNKKGGNGIYLRFNVYDYVYDISYDKILKADKLLNLAYKNTSNNIQKQRVEDLLEMWEFCKMNFFYFRQKKSSSIKLINYNKVTKKEIDLKINELKKHPLYKDIARRYKNPSWVRY